MTEPPATEYEPPPAPDTQVEVAAETAAADDRGDTSQLPGQLRSRFQLRELLRRPERPGQAAVYRVRDAEGRGHVVKWYARGHATNPHVRRILGAERLPHVTHLAETGEIGGHPYEIAPSFGNTTLTRYRQDHPGPANPALVGAVVEQMHAALTAVHQLGIVHRDVTPANIVLGSLDPADPQVTLIDFATAAYATEERLAGSDDPRVGTLPYMSPQALLSRQMIHPQTDWWSLGMIVAELAGGAHPIRHSHEDYVRFQLSSRPPDLSRVTDPRLLRLCRGLLTRDPDQRWGSEQLAQWLAGQSPAVEPEWPGERERDEAATAASGFTFMGTEFTEPSRLGIAFDANWRLMERALAHRSTRRSFIEWLRQFDAPAGDAADTTDAGDTRDELVELIGLLERRRTDPATLVRLVSWLAPWLEPGFRGEPLGHSGNQADELTALAARAEDGEERALSIVGNLARHGILTLLDNRPGGEGLAGIDRAWQEARRRWGPGVEALCSEFPALRRRLREDPALTALTAEDGRLTAQLLRAAAAPERCRAVLDERATWRLGQLPQSVDWYSWLVKDRRDVLRLLLADRLSGLAEEESWRIEARWRETQIGVELGQAAAWVNAHQLPVALGWAVGGAAAVTLPWIFVIGLADVLGWAPQATVITAWSYAVPSAVVTFALELWAAHRIGYLSYHPERSLAGRLVGAAGRAARPVRRHRVLGALAVTAAVGLLYATLVLAAWAWPAGTVLAVAWWTWRRHRATAPSALGNPTANATGGTT